MEALLLLAILSLLRRVIAASPAPPPAACRNLLAAHHHHLVHHVDDDADMVRHDPHDIADIGAGVAAARSRKPCSSAKRAILASGCSRIRPWPSSPPPVSDVSVLEPASRMPRSEQRGSPRSNRCERAVVPAGNTGGDLHAVVVDVGAGAMLGGAVELAEVFQVRRAAGRDHGGVQPVRAHAGQRLVVKFLRIRPAGFGRIEHEAGNAAP